jgi:hypothetical protein
MHTNIWKMLYFIQVAFWCLYLHGRLLIFFKTVKVLLFAYNKEWQLLWNACILTHFPSKFVCFLWDYNTYHSTLINHWQCTEKQLSPRIQFHTSLTGSDIRWGGEQALFTSHVKEYSCQKSMKHFYFELNDDYPYYEGNLQWLEMNKNTLYLALHRRKWSVSHTSCNTQSAHDEDPGNQCTECWLGPSSKNLGVRIK